MCCTRYSLVVDAEKVVVDGSKKTWLQRNPGQLRKKVSLFCICFPEYE